MDDAVSTTIPGAKNPLQAEQNAASADFPPLSPETMQKVTAIYDQHIKPLVHAYW
jgi:aryl-alcohol dehydrogenase-like predicted oxidoreductase